MSDEAQQRAFAERVQHNVNEMISQYNRPYRLTNATFEKYGTGWQLAHQGLVAYGETPAICAENFDHLWTFGEKE